MAAVDRERAELMGKKYKFREVRKARPDEARYHSNLKCVDFVAGDGDIFTIAHTCPRIIAEVAKLDEWDGDSVLDFDDFDAVERLKMARHNG